MIFSFFPYILAADSSDQSKDLDLLSHLLKSLATLAGSFDAKNICDLLQASQDSQKLGASAGTSSVPNGLIPDGRPVQSSTKELPSTAKMTRATSIHGPPLRTVNDSVCVAVAAADNPSEKQLTEASLGQYALEVSFFIFPLSKRRFILR